MRPHSINRTAIGLAALAILAAHAASRFQSAALLAQSPDAVTTIRTSTHLVLLDVSVWDWKGDPVTGLNQGDFHLFEDGHEQTIKNVEEHVPIDPVVAHEKLAALAAQLPSNTYTNFSPFPETPTVNVIVLDALTSTPTAVEGYRQDIVAYLKKAPAGTPFVIFRLDTQLRMLQDLTTDPARMLAAVSVRPKDNSLPTETYVQRQQIVGSALNQLSRYLAPLPGRKTLLWFSEAIGIALSSTGDHNDQAEAALFCKWTDALQQNRIDSYRVADEGKAGSGLGCREGRRAGNSIAAVVNNAAHYYTIAYTPANEAWDGHYRKFKVTVKGKDMSAWKGVDQDYRDGYYARSDDGSVHDESAAPAPNAESRAMQIAIGMGSIEPADLVFEAKLSPAADIVKDQPGAAAAPGNFLNEKFRGQGYRNVGVRYAVKASQLKLLAVPNQPTYAAGLEVVAVLYDPQGQAVNSKKGRISAGFAGLDDPKIQTASVTANLNIQVPAEGNYFLRLAVRDVATDKVGALETPTSSIVLATDAGPAGGSAK